MANEEKSQVNKKNLQEEQSADKTKNNTKQEKSSKKAVNENTEGETVKQDVKEEAPKDEIQQKLEKTEEDLKKQKEVLLRTAAEYDNYRKRTEREKTTVYNEATSAAVAEILPVADNLERALKQEDCDAKDLKKGVEMVNKQLIDALTKLGVTAMGEVGDEFNPDFHNAVSHIDDKNAGENTIVKVLQKGYKIGDKIVRHAMVQVAN